MANYTVLLQSQPEKYYRKSPPKIAKALDQCFARLEESPGRYLTKVKRLKGYENLYRYRIGNLRVVYEINDDKREVSVAAILPRGNVYKKL